MTEPGGEISVPTCQDFESAIAAYVDGESASCDCDAIRLHVESCVRCREFVAAQRVAREAVRAMRSGLRACASDGLKARCASLAAQTPAPLRHDPARLKPAYAPSFVRRWAPLSVAATLVLVAAMVFGFELTDTVQALAFQTTIDHVKCTRSSAGAVADAGAAPVDPISAARQWQSRFGWPITVPPASVSPQLELRAVRRCAVSDGRIAHLMYTWRGEPLSVYVLPKRTLGDATAFVKRFGHSAVMWSQNERTYIIVTEHPRDAELERVTAYVKASAF